MTELQQLYDLHGQSPWLDNLTRRHLRRGDLARLVDAGNRGVTSNPTIFAKVISGSSDYDEQFRALADAGATVTDFPQAFSHVGVIGAAATWHEPSAADMSRDVLRRHPEETSTP